MITPKGAKCLLFLDSSQMGYNDSHILDHTIATIIKILDNMHAFG